MFNSSQTTFKVGDEFKLAEIRRIICYPAAYDFQNDSIIKDLAQFLNRNPKLIVVVEFHTDTRGSVEGNLKVSQSRAANLFELLIAKGTKKEQIRNCSGLGENEPIFKESEINSFKRTDKAKFDSMQRANRRSILRIVEIKE